MHIFRRSQGDLTSSRFLNCCVCIFASSSRSSPMRKGKQKLVGSTPSHVPQSSLSPSIALCPRHRPPASSLSSPPLSAFIISASLSPSFFVFFRAPVHSLSSSSCSPSAPISSSSFVSRCGLSYSLSPSYPSAFCLSFPWLLSSFSCCFSPTPVLLSCFSFFFFF